VPSMKSKVKSANDKVEQEDSGYTAYLAFGGQCKEMFGYPYSCCGCYDGRGLCSHLLALLLEFMLIQRSPSKEEYMLQKPPPASQLQNTPELCEFSLLYRSTDAKKQKRVHDATRLHDATRRDVTERTQRNDNNNCSSNRKTRLDVTERTHHNEFQCCVQ